VKHPDRVEKYPGSLKEMARDATNMRYDSLAEFVDYMADYLKQDSDADSERGRKKLESKIKKAVNSLHEAEDYVRENELEKAAKSLYEARDYINEAWVICEPYMPPDDIEEVIE
jgi:hypothetical protein